MSRGRLAWSLSWRLFGGRRTRLLSGTTWAALLATALGVAAMVIAMALMTGYREDLQAKLVQGSAAMAAYPQRALTEGELQRALETAATTRGVEEARLVAYGQGSLSSAARPDGVDVTYRGLEGGSGLDAVCELKWLPPPERPSGTDDGARALEVIVGRQLHEELRPNDGEPLELMALRFGGGRPSFRYASARVVGVCETGFAEFDRQWVLLDRARLESLIGEAGLSVIEMTIEGGHDPELVELARGRLGDDFLVSDYLDLNRELFAALRLQQWMLFLVLGLIVFVSTFNTASSLVVLVRERRRDFGVLAALGLSPEEQRGVFLRYGLLLGLFGTLLGVLLGSGVSWALNEFELIRFDSEMAAIYFLSAVPFRVVARDVLAVAAFTMAVTLLACWLPARRAGRLDPSEALRSE